MRLTRLYLMIVLSVLVGLSAAPRPAIAQSAGEGDAGAAQAAASEQASVSQKTARRRKSRASTRKKWASAVLVVITDFSKSQVKVNGLAYPAYVDESSEPGMVLPAGGPYSVEVSYDGKSKFYELYLKPNETRYLMVDLSGFQGGGARPSTPPPRPAPQPDEEEPAGDEGRVTVYSNPKGEILVDGKSAGEKSPGTVTVPSGRHEVQVRFESGKESERKIIRVRKGSRIKLFFREGT